MGVMKEAFVDLREKYNKVKKLVEEDSKLDPETEPYLSKYAARQLLISMKASLEKLIDQTSENSDKLIAMLGIVWYYLGTISVETEELSTGETQLNKAVGLVEHNCLQPEFILIMLNALNQLGILWSQRDDVEKSKEFLEKSQKLYLEFKDLYIDPVTFNKLFDAAEINENPFKSLEGTHTLTLYYLAQVYGNLKDSIKSAFYCHVTLNRQLEYNEYDHVDWAVNAATLSQFLMEKNLFKQARHHLAAASYMLNCYETRLEDTIDRGEEYDAKMEVFKHRSADVARCWAKYGLLLLSSSRDRLMHQSEEEDESTVNETPPGDLSDLYFSNLDLHGYEQQVTDQYALTFDDAKEIFINIQSWLNDAQLYYTLANHASDYVQIIQDVSHMYDYLAFFEDNPERQSKMHKRRIDQLEGVVKELNPTYYLHICRELWYELGEIYLTILEIKLDKLRTTSERPTAHALTKINSLIEKGIQNFVSFLDTVKEVSEEENEDPVKLSNDLERPVLKAYFRIAVFYGKFITPDKKIQAENNSKSLKFYKKMVKYCDKFENSCEGIQTELSVAKEMVILLPLKILTLTQESQS